MRRGSGSSFLWSDLIEFRDHFKDNTSYTKSSLEKLANQYANVSDEAVVLIKDLIDNLTIFQSLMQLNKTDLEDNDESHQGAVQIFNALERVQENLNRALPDTAVGNKRNEVYRSAINWSKQFIQHQVYELEAHEPSSLALKWYHEHTPNTRGQGNDSP